MKRTPIGYLVVSVLVVACLWVGYWIVAYNAEGESAARGQFGDMFGGLSSLFTGLAFAGAFYAIMQQRDIMANQQYELNESKKDQQATVAEFQRQCRALELSAAVQALKARIDRYDIQIDHLRDAASRFPEASFREETGETTTNFKKFRGMKDEQHSLTKELDSVLQKAVACAKNVTQ